ncbi:MAG: M3 family oligoendopeptidase [Turicibacter sp.]|nr:M3 family oligoendopeptidase [Turicibacter sp.]
METTWSLKELYESFESEAFLKDVEKVDEIIKRYDTYAQSLSQTDESDIKKLETYLEFQIEMSNLFQRLFSFCSLTLSTNTSDETALKYSDILNEKTSHLASSEAIVNHYIGSLKNIDSLLSQSKQLAEHAFLFHEIQQFSKYLLSDKEEAVIAKLQNTGSVAWSKLKDMLTSKLMVEVPLHGETKSMSLTMARNLAHDKDATVRKAAYEAELKAYEKIDDSLAACLSNIKGEVLSVCKMRGYDSPLEETLLKSRLTQKTLDAMLTAIIETLPKFREFLKVKAQYLGHKNGLPFYDLFAPLGTHNQAFDYEQGTQYVLKLFKTFSDDLSDYAKNAMEGDWIDVYPKQGKVGGAFCSNLHVIKQSRVLLNYGDQFIDVVTMAHELGHGYHGYCLEEESILNTSYPMPLAETASTFCETIVKKAAIKEGNEEQAFAVLEQELTDSTQVIVDIYSRYLFETELFKRRKESSVSVKELNEMMIEAQKEAYGDGLDPNYLHPYMWACKPHYYDASSNFYNFPYAFGLLFAKGLYAKYQEQGEDFPEAYKKLLSVTGKLSTEDVAKTIDIDLEDQAFWKKSLDLVSEDIEQFKKLAQKRIKNS